MHFKKKAHLRHPMCCAQSLQSCSTLCIPIDLAHLAPLSMEFSRQEYWSELPYSSLGDLLDPGMESVFVVSPALQAYSLPTELPGKPQTPAKMAVVKYQRTTRAGEDKMTAKWVHFAAHLVPLLLQVLSPPCPCGKVSEVAFHFSRI